MLEVKIPPENVSFGPESEMCHFQFVYNSDVRMTHYFIGHGPFIDDLTTLVKSKAKRDMIVSESFLI